MSQVLSQTNSTARAECPECAGAVTFSRTPIRGEVVRCADCSAELEVTQREPLTVALAPEVEEDWGE